MRVLKALLLSSPICVAFALYGRPLPHTQTASPSLKFEVASIKPFSEQGAMRNARGGIISGGSCHGVDDPHPSSIVPLGRCTYVRTSLTQLILQTFPPPERLVTSGFVTTNPNPSLWVASAETAERTRIMPLDQWVTGGPAWAGSEFFNIEAKADDSLKPTVSQLRQMLQAFVLETFKLTYHYAPKDVSGYFIVAAKGGPKLQPAPQTPPDPAVVARRRESVIKPFPLISGNLDTLALMLTINMRSPIVNQTGIAGNFDFTGLDGVDFGGPSPSDSDAPGGSIFSALEEKLGLKLEPHKIPVQIFVIDRAERPAEN